jgi:hypothetical protein
MIAISSASNGGSPALRATAIIPRQQERLRADSADRAVEVCE